ncbi:BQ2448_5701 [Microbotryum intermedium]|uniref:BQ2448_5701 protein n=1 Tax=Microbotryum intermedium TaxID=269621 RepID=A0A238F214_9BASI|nr:BQ2448_5701 [Microbotryum intermedium]
MGRNLARFSWRPKLVICTQFGTRFAENGGRFAPFCGLPRLRARLPTSKKRPIRAFIALALDTLSNRRWDLHRHAKAMSSMDKEMAGLKERLELRLAR